MSSLHRLCIHAAKANTWPHFYFTEKTERMESNTKSMNLIHRFKSDSSFKERQTAGYVDLRGVSGMKTMIRKFLKCQPWDWMSLLKERVKGEGGRKG